MTHWRTLRCRSGSDLLSPTGLHGYKLQATHILEGRLPCSKEISIALVLETGEYLPDDIAGFEIRNKGLVRIACEQVFCRQIHIEKEGRIEALENALKSRKPDEPGQVERIVRELFEKAQRSWLAVKLLEPVRLRKMRRPEFIAKQSRNSCFDKVYTVHTLYFWPQPLNYAREIARILKPGGRFVLGFRTGGDPETRNFPSSIYRFYTADDVQALLRGGGFKEINMMRRQSASEGIVFAVCDAPRRPENGTSSAQGLNKYKDVALRLCDGLMTQPERNRYRMSE